MKRLISLLLAGSMLALFTALPAQAQLSGTAMRVTIPFDFNVRGKTLPSGKYVIRRIGAEPDRLMIYNNDNHEHVIFASEPVGGAKFAERGEVVFHKYGDTYFLFEIWSRGEATGAEALPSRAERRLEREVANNGGSPALVALAIE